ncbi:hypothetical protein Pmani_000865 [Petrolisthes manimaculis]|uniref:Uncharacterized protein n=1 Tax=Petrolisthes manimaculis TaxID=1843537 RepID=A0AAE1ULX4_9EUCA|nr:hypothetical protein Pmani_000865 [Petrolisthes manimaculis]
MSAMESPLLSCCAMLSPRHQAERTMNPTVTTLPDQFVQGMPWIRVGTPLLKVIWKGEKEKEVLRLGCRLAGQMNNRPSGRLGECLDS